MAQVKSFAKSQPVVEMGLRWSNDSAEKHSLTKSFIRVGGEKASTRFLSGASRSWSNPNSEENMTVFVLPLRISGTADHIKEALKLAQPPYTEEEINEFLKDAITKDNYQTTKAEEYDEEIASYKKMKEDKVPVEHYSVEQLNWFCDPDIIKNVRVESKKSAPKTQGNESVKSRTAPGASIKERIEKLNDGFILDISGMTSDYKNIKTKPIPKTNKSGKFYSAPLPFLTNDYDKYYEIINHVYGSDGLIKYADNLEHVKKQLSVGKSNPSFKSLIPQPHTASTTSTTSTTTTTRTLIPKPSLLPQAGATTKTPKVQVINPVSSASLSILPTMK